MKSGSTLAPNIPFPSSRTRGIWILLSFSLLLFSSARAELQMENSKDVGFGFRVVTKSGVVGPNAWEVGHFGFLYYQDTELTQFGTYSIAPSGKYALFQDMTGAVTLFAAATGQRTVVAKPQRSVAEQYVWHEKEGDAVVVFANRSSIRLSLSKR
jgi:hypothetical protein